MNKKNLFYVIGGFIFGSLFWMIVIFIILSVSPVKGQTVSINPLKQSKVELSFSPTSAQFFGKMPNTAKLTASWKGFEAVAYYNYQTIYAVHKIDVQKHPFSISKLKSVPVKKGFTFGVF